MLCEYAERVGEKNQRVIYRWNKNEEKLKESELATLPDVSLLVTDGFQKLILKTLL